MQSHHRHCRCSDALIEVITGVLRANKDVRPDHPLLVALAANRGKILRSCPGAPVPEVDWPGIELALPAIIRSELQNALEASSIPEDEVEEVMEALEAYGAPGRVSAAMTGAVRKIWDALLHAKFPSGAIRVH